MQRQRSLINGGLIDSMTPERAKAERIAYDKRVTERGGVVAKALASCQGCTGSVSSKAVRHGGGEWARTRTLRHSCGIWTSQDGFLCTPELHRPVLHRLGQSAMGHSRVPVVFAQVR